MARNINDKYGSNRNLWRKSYIPGVRRPPEIATIIVPDTDVTYSIDLNKTVRHRDFFRIIDVQPLNRDSSGGGIIFGEYDEDLIHFNNETSKTFNFNIVFSSTPTLVFTMEYPASGVNSFLAGTENIIPYGISKSINSASLGLSAPYSGTVRYRAVYSSFYPVNCTSFFTSSIFCSAGEFIPANESAYTASYTDLGSSANIFLQSPYDDFGRSDSDVFIENQTKTSNIATNEISARISSSINFIAYA